MPWFRKASSDATVVQRIRAGRRDDFAVLVDRYLPVAHAVSYAQLHNVCDAEDAAQDAFIKAFESLDGLRDPDKFGPWLLTIVRNICRNQKRGRAREAERVDAIARTEPSPAHQLEDRELQILVRQQVEGLDDIHREVLLLHYYGGRCVKDIAALLELSQDAVKKRLQRAREALSAQMLRHLEPAVAPERGHRDRVKTIMGLLAGVTAAWEAGAASATGAAAGAGAAGVAGTLASSAIGKIIAAMAAALAVTGAVVYWPGAQEPAVQDTAQETVVAQNAESRSAAASEQTDRTDPADRSDLSDRAANAPAIPETGYFILGRTVDQSGNPVAKAAVVLDPYDPVQGDHHETESGEDGWFIFPDLKQTTYLLQATALGIFGADEMGSDTAENHEMHEIAMLPAGALDGVVRSKDGTPVPDVMVMPVRGNWTGEEEYISDRWQELRGVYTDADGRFRLAPIWLGSWKLQVDSPTYARYESDFLPVNESPVTLTLTPGAHVEGRVVYAGTDTPVPELKVNMMTGRSTVTDSDGRFVLDGVQPGGSSVGVNHDTLIRVSEGFMVPEGGNVTGVTVEVAQGGIITGRVYDAQTGEGISPAWISIENPEVRSADGDSNDGENGRYRITKLRPGTYHVRSVEGGIGYLDARNPAHDPLVVKLGTTITGVDFGLTKGVTVRGTVHAPPGATLEDMKIWVTYTEQASEPYRRRGRGTSRSKAGDFTISGFAPGEPVTVQAKAGAWASEIAGPFTLRTDGVHGVTLTLVQRPVGSVSGRVVYGGGVPLSAARVTIRSTTGDHTDSVESDANGGFSFADLPVGDYRINVHAPGMAIASRETRVFVSPGQAVTNIEIDLGGGTSTIAGTVVDDLGAPIANVRISRSIPGPGSTNTKSDADGQFALPGLCSGGYDVLFVADGHAAVGLDSVAAGTTDLRVVLERTGSVEGRVIDGRTGQPMTEFEVAVTSRTDPQTLARPLFLYNRYVNDSGAYRVDNVPPGSRAAVARAAGCFPVSAVVNVQPGQIVSGVDLILKPGAVVHATVVDPFGQPLAETSVFVGALPHSFNEPRFAPATVKTGPDGTCSLENLVPGANAIYVYHPDYAPAEFAVEVQGGSTPSEVFALEAGGTVEGVVTVEGEPAADASVQLDYTDADFPDFDRIDPSATTDDTGAFRIDGLIGGVVRVKAYTAAGVIERSVDVVQGQTTRVNLELGGGTAAVSGIVQAPPELSGIGRTGVMLTVETPEGQAQYHSSVDDDGRFAFRNVMAGQGTLIVMGETGGGGRVGKRASVVIPPGGEVMHDFDLTRGAIVQGTVTINGDYPEVYVLLIHGEVDLAAMNNATYANSLYLRTMGQVIVSGTTGFQFDAVDPGEYSLMIATEGPTQVTGKPLTVREGESVVNVDIAFP